MTVIPSVHPADFILRLILNSEGHDPFLFDQPKNGQWRLLAKLAQKNVVLLRTFERVEKRGISLPSSIIEMVQAESQRIARTVQLIQELDRVCLESNIIFVFTKAFQHYPDMGHDVDLFVMDNSRRIDHLIKQKFGTHPLGGSFFNRIAGKTAYAIEGLPSSLEIHHGRLGHVGEHGWYARLMAERRVRLTRAGVTTFVPSNEDQLILQTIQRVYDHMYLRLSDVIQGSQLIKDGSLDWDYLKKTTQAMGISDGFFYYLDSIRRVNSSVLDTQLFIRLKALRVGRPLASKVYFRDAVYRFPLFKAVGFLRLKQLLISLKARGDSNSLRLCLLPVLGLIVSLRSLFFATLNMTYRMTIATEAFNLISAIFVYRLAASHLGHDGFSQYILTRKAASLLLPALALGLDTGIARNIAFHRNSSDGFRVRSCYFFGGLFSVLLMILISSLGFLFLRDKLAFLFYGDRAYAHLLLPLGLLLAGTSLVSISYSYFQGTQYIFRANALQFVHYGILPLAILLAWRGNAFGALTLLGVGSLASAVVAIGVILRNLELTVVPASFLRRLLSYSLPRIPGTFGSMALLNLPAVFTAHVAGIREAGYVALGSAMLTLASSAIYPIRVILLPMASSMIAAGELAPLSSHVFRTVKFLLPLAVFLTLFIEVFVEVIVRVFLGGFFPDAVRLIRIMAIGIPAWVTHMYLRSLIDAYHETAVNTRAILGSLGAFLIIALLIMRLGGGSTAITLAFVAALYLLGIASWREMKKICD